MDALNEAIEQTRASEKSAEQTWAYGDVLSYLTPSLEAVAMAGASEQEAQEAQAVLKYHLRLAQACSGRDPSMKGVTRGLEYLVQAIDTTDNLRTELVEDALARLLLEVKFCISARE